MKTMLGTDVDGAYTGKMNAGKKILILASVASMIDQFNMPNIRLVQEMGYQVHVACNFRKGNTCDQKRLRKLHLTFGGMGVVQHQWDCPRGSDGFRTLPGSFKAYRQLCILLDREQFDWIHCHSPIGGAIARIAAHQKGIPVIYTVHGFHFYQGAPLKNWLFYYPAEKLLSGWTDVLITINQEDFKLAKRRMYAKKVRCIPGVGIDCMRFHETCIQMQDRERFCGKYQIPVHARIILSVGELNKGKNHKLVIAALAEISRADVYYLICGQGILQEKLYQYAKKLGIADHVRMPGYQEDMPQIYRNADIFVFPSMREGMPVALMEAMAAGLPCVVSDIRGSRELMRDTADSWAGYDSLGGFRPGGYCFLLDQPGQLVYALRRFLDDTDLRRECGRYNQEKIKRYDQSKVRKRMYEIYAEFGVQNMECRLCREADVCVNEKQKLDVTTHAVDISVIMPVYNMANDKAFYQAVASIFRQTCQNWELILCDDGSSDDTLCIMHRFAAMDKRVHVIRNKINRGAGYARNACIRIASGKYLALMDADDISDPRRLEKQAAFLDRHPEYALVGCNVWLRDRHGVWGRRRLEEEPGRESFLGTLPFVNPSIMIRTEIVRKMHGYTQTHLARRAEDYEFLMRLYAAGYRGYNIQEELLGYLEDTDAYRKRSYRDRVCECAVRWRGFQRLGMLKGHLRYVAKPLVVGLIPGWMLRMQRRRRFSLRQESTVGK